MDNRKPGDIKEAVEYLNRQAAVSPSQSPAAPGVIGTSVPGMEGAVMSEYTPGSIKEIAEILAPQAGNYTNALAGQIGQAQQSMGPLAGRTMGTPVQGLGNYTYNRLIRPQVDVMRDEILVQGYTNSLNKMLSDSLNAARDNYNSRSSSGGSGSSSGSNAWNGEIEREALDSTDVTKHENKNYELMWVVDPSGNRTQWKRAYGAFGIGGYDTPSQSYTLASGTNRLRELAKQGYKITDNAGNDITSRYK